MKPIKLNICSGDSEKFGCAFSNRIGRTGYWSCKAKIYCSHQIKGKLHIKEKEKENKNA